MAWNLLKWRQKAATTPGIDAYIQKMMDGLGSPDVPTHLSARRSFTRMIKNNEADFTADDIILMLNAFAEQEGLPELKWLLTHIEFLSDPPQYYQAPPELQAAAQRCLNRHLERIQPDYLAQTLLHPSDVPGAELLRPSQETPETHPETLLRPTHSNETTEKREHEPDGNHG